MYPSMILTTEMLRYTHTSLRQHRPLRKSKRLLIASVSSDFALIVLLLSCWILGSSGNVWQSINNQIIDCGLAYLAPRFCVLSRLVTFSVASLINITIENFRHCGDVLPIEESERLSSFAVMVSNGDYVLPSHSWLYLAPQ